MMKGADLHQMLPIEVRAAIAGGLVQGAFVLVGIVFTAWIASATVTRELRLAQTASAVATFLDGLAEERHNPRVGGAKIGAAMAQLAGYGDPELVAAMAELRRCMKEETVLHLYRVLRKQAGAERASTRDLIQMYDVTPDAGC